MNSGPGGDQQVSYVLRLVRGVPYPIVRAGLVILGGLGIEQWRLQIRRTGYRFGNPGGPKVRFNYLYGAREWIEDPEDPYHFETFFDRLGLTEHYDFVVSDRPDFVLMSVYGYQPARLRFLRHWCRRAARRVVRRLDGEGLDPAADRYAFPRFRAPFQRIFLATENVAPQLDACEWALGFAYEQDVRDPRYTRLPIYVFCAPENELVRLTKPRAPAEIPESRRFCAFLHYHDVPVRNALFDELSRYERVDAPGRCRNNMDKPASLTDETTAGLDRSKLDFLRGYRFTIACENDVSPGYTTEMLVTPMLAGSIPVYYGNPAVVREFNPDSFVHLGDEDWALPVAERLKRLREKVEVIDRDSERYAAMWEQPPLSAAQWAKLSRAHFVERFGRIFDGARPS